MPPRVLFAGHTRYRLPLDPSLARKWDAVGARVDVRVIGTAGDGDGTDRRFRLFRFTGPRRLGGPAFYAALPWLVADELRRFRPNAVVAQSPYEAFALLPVLQAAGARRPRLIVEVHGDWRTAARLYGSTKRHAIAPLADRAARVALRRADATRALTAYTARLAQEATGVAPVAVFPTFFDLHSFRAEPQAPLPETPTVLWVGVLQRYKNPVGFARAWSSVAARVPGARLHVVGEGPLEPVITDLVRRFPGRVSHTRRLPPPEVSRCYDASTVLALPSRSEGMGRVIIEAFTRARPVVASDVGGIGDLVDHGRNGLLVAPGDDDALADALTAMLSDRALAERLSVGAASDAPEFAWTAERYADAVAAMVRRVTA